MNTVKFHPIQCTSQQLFGDELDLHDGELYFLTDTKQIYIVRDNQAIEMCGGINIIYGNREIVHENDGHAIPPEQIFSIMDDLNNEILMKNDLILNKDGCFYKVVSVENDTVHTLRVTLQGNGFNNGSSSNDAVYGLSVLVRNNIFSSKTDHMYIGFRADCQQVEDNFIDYVCFTFEKPFDEGGIPFYELDDVHYDFNVDHKDIDLINYINLFDENQKTIYINTEDRYGHSHSKSFTIRLVDLLLTPVYGAVLRNSDADINICPYSCNIGGATSGISNKKLSISFFSETNSMKPIYSYEIDMATNKVDNFDTQLDLDALGHGVYDVEIALTAQIVGTTKVLSSNVLTHKLIKFVDVNSPLLAFKTPKQFEQYTNNEIFYYLATNDTNDYDLRIVLDSVEKAEILIKPNEIQSYPLYLDERQGTCNLSFIVPSLGIEKSHLIDIVAYSGDSLPTIDPLDPSLKLYLTPNGYSNNLKDRDKWYDYNGKYCAQLSSDLSYSNSSGWITDKNNITYLQLTSGAKLNLTDYEPFKTDPTVPPQGATRGSGITIELDFEVDGITDYTQDIISCISKHTETMVNVVGFSLTGNVLKFFSSQKNGHGKQGALTALKITEGKRIRASFVIEPKLVETDPNYANYFPMCYTYINGILSNAVIYDQNDHFEQYSAQSPALLSIDSTHAAIKIYGIRIYQTALTARQILNNYTASLPTLIEREEKHKFNDVYNDNSLIDYGKVASENYDLQIPYMVLTGGYRTDADNDKWQLLPVDKVGQPGLPTGKKDYRMVDVKVVYPNTPYFNRYEDFGGYNDYNFTNEFENGGWITDNFGKKAKNGGCIMYAQGTSSMEYPVKNLRLRFNKVKKVIGGEEVKSKENYFTVRPDIEPVEIICMKADYMESSGSHNTGAANLIDDLYATANMKTPGQAHFGPREGNEQASTIVTCIKGHPCLIFYSPSGEKGTYQYIGKYNLNLDKATPAPFGFDHDDDFGWLPEGNEYWAIDYDDDGTKFIGQEDPDSGGDYDDTKIGEERKVVTSEDKINAIHCFEFLDNAIAVCNFLNKKPSDDDIDTNPVQNWDYFINKDVSPSKYKANTFYIHNGEEFVLSTSEIFDSQQKYYDRAYTFEDTWYRLFKKPVEGKIKKLPGWALGFESRYPEDRIGYHDADMLYPLASWLNELYRLKTYGSDILVGPTKADIDMANLRFVNEYQRYFDKDFLLFYYIVTEALLMADNRVKNMMIATWGPEQRTFERVDNTTETVFNYIWYPIFYDMDTMLGLDNTGVDKFQYYEEDTDPGVYNGDEVLWNFVRDNLTNDLDQMYTTLESILNTRTEADGSWSPTSLIPYFNANQATMANEAFYNGDAVYKYLDPARTGYYDGLTGKKVEAGDAPYLYAAQGDRSLTRENFIINRIKFLQGKHNSSLFLNSDQIEFRWNYPSATDGQRYAEVIFTEDKIYEPGVYYYDNNGQYVIDNAINKTDDRQYFELIYDNALAKSAQVVEPTTDFNFIAAQPCFAGILLGKNGSVYKERFEPNTEVSITVPEGSSANNTEAYILGLSSLKTLGDLSNKYVQKFVMSGKSKLSELILGNPHKDYYNPYWSSDTSSARIGLGGCVYLETFNLQNCSSFRSALDFSPCPIIETILLTGSSVSGITLPINGNLKELRLPATISVLDINSHKELRNFSLGGYNYEGGNKIGEGGHYENDYSGLEEVYIIDTPIDSYDILSNAIGLTKYYVENFEWEITNINDCQYIYTTDSTPDENKTYYIWNNTDKEFVQFVGDVNSPDWNRAREKCDLVKNGSIIQIPILEQLLTKQAELKGKPISSIEGYPGAGGLIGTIKISVNAKVDEFNIYSKYKKYFPNVKFEFNVGVDSSTGESNLSPAYTIEFYNTEYTDQLKPYYSVLTNGEMSLETLISANGPNGIPLSEPSKAATDTNIFTFTGSWKKIGVENQFISMESFKNYYPKENLKLEAKFDPSTRFYPIKFYDCNGLNPVTVNYTFNQYMIDNPETPKYVVKPDTGLQDHERYGFVGWMNQKDYIDSSSNPKIIDLETTQINLGSATDLYPYHRIEDATQVATNIKYFTFSEVNISLSKESYDGNNNLVTTPVLNQTEYMVSIKDEYKSSLSGKITLPSRDANGREVTLLGSLSDPNKADEKITHIYFLPDAKYRILGEHSFGQSGFYNLKNLTTVYFPENMNSLKYIGQLCFALTSNLTNIINLPNSIEYIGAQAFQWSAIQLKTLPTSLNYIGNSGFIGSKIELTSLPISYTQILPNTFNYCSNIKIENFGNSNNGAIDQTSNNITHIGASAFENTTSTTVNKIFLGNSIVYLGDNCFYNYGIKDGINITNESNISIANNYTKYFGDRSNPTISDITIS